MMSLTALAYLAALLPVALQESPVPAANSANIEWVLPAGFDAALKRAKVDNRLLPVELLQRNELAIVGRRASNGLWSANEAHSARAKVAKVAAAHGPLPLRSR